MHVMKLAAVGMAVLVTGTALAQMGGPPASPRGTAATQVAGKWERQKPEGPQTYVGGKWIEIDYGRPILRQRADMFGSGGEYAKGIYAGAPIWRAGANKSTRLKTEAPLMIGGKRIEPGEYSLFIDTKPGNWTFVVSTWAAQEKFNKDDKAALWGGYGYEPSKDVARAPMQLMKSTVSVDQLTWGFVDVTADGGKMAIWWEKEFAVVPFTVAK
jgi:hypothetical protein